MKHRNTISKQLRYTDTTHTHTKILLVQLSQIQRELTLRDISHTQILRTPSDTGCIHNYSAYTWKLHKITKDTQILHTHRYNTQTVYNTHMLQIFANNTHTHTHTDTTLPQS